MRSPFSRIEPQEYERESESSKLLVMEKFERCAFCNSKLIFSHDLNLSYLQVIETGRCPGCGVSMSPKKYTLQ
jgi:uncharacterized protein with PIN domain